jgi:hypothetical protein
MCKLASTAGDTNVQTGISWQANPSDSKAGGLNDKLIKRYIHTYALSYRPKRID